MGGLQVSTEGTDGLCGRIEEHLVLRTCREVPLSE